MSEEENIVDATNSAPPAEVAGYMTNNIQIRRILTDDDRDRIFVDWPDDASLLELMGMLEFAKTIIWEWYTTPAKAEEEDE